MTHWELPDRIRLSGSEVAAGAFGDGPPVILTHGTPASSFLWRNVVPALAREHRVFVWDMLGFGGSRLDAGATPTIVRQAQTLAELIHHWQLDAPGLVGHDIGGGVVLRAHLLEHVPASWLVLVDAAVLGPWNTEFTEHMQRNAEAYRTMPEHVFADLIGPRLRTATYRPMPEGVADAYLAPWRGKAGQQRWIDQVAAVSFADTREVVDRLDRIAVPTLVLWGERDSWLTPDVADQLAAAVPGARKKLVGDAGHFLPEDAPDEVAKAILSHAAANDTTRR
ncbi:alpha/beta fold hydrolase [Jiangella gansuensis]|uniref:alpha/beta fold hydrolase n=1 Tax=Jiangella gansuensis TaxID=281473 RepID=UPI00047EA9E5|nr:alpha/beta hydrolase [Jiangella gansuensis]